MNLELILGRALANAPPMNPDDPFDGQPLEKGERLVGGRADGRPDSDFDPEELEAGAKHELEHTGDSHVAREIAKDHLVEDRDYYRKLRAMERR